MLLKNILILLIFLYSGYCKISAQSDAYSKDLKRLYSLSLNNLNISNTQKSDSIIFLCQKLEPQARKNNDDYNTFLIGQILVNASCQKGDIATAITKSKQLYEEANKKSAAQGIALALQALGNIYMYSGQYSDAANSYSEAEEEADKLKDENIRVRLYLQQLHTHLNRRSIDESKYYLTQLEESSLVKSDTLLNAQVLYYKVLVRLLDRNIQEATEIINTLSARENSLEELWLLRQRVLSRYYTATADYNQAKSIVDTLLGESLKSGNNFEYRDLLWLKARIFSLSEEYDPACVLYETVREMSDSINIGRYISSVDTLRATHHTYKMKLENISSNNRLIAQGGALVLLFIAAGVVFYFMLRRKNKMLKKSKAELSATTEASTKSIQTKSVFLSNMSHDLRTPLNAIAGFSGILASEDEVDDETKKMCGEYIQQNSELLLKLFNDILDLSALNENKMRFQFKSCNVTSLCRNVTDTVKSIKSSDNELLFESHAGDLVFNTDSVRLQQVLINLLVNSTKFTQNGTIRLILDVDKENQMAVFTVEDTGCGIPLEKQPGIFERFEKLNEKKQGAGLGLSICKLIVDHFEGQIWIDSAYTEGTRFIFTHPLNIEQ